MDVDPIQVAGTALVIGFFLLAPFLFSGESRLRHAVAVRVSDVGSRMLHRLQAPEPSELTAEDRADLAERLAARRRSDQVATVDRLRTLVDHDGHESATRQRAHRMAYERAVADLAALPTSAAPSPATRWTPVTASVLQRSVPQPSGVEPSEVEPSEVEHLDLGGWSMER